MIDICYLFIPREGHITLCDLATSINSVKIHRNVDSDYRITVFTIGISDEDSNLISQLSCPGFMIEFRKLTDTYQVETGRQPWCCIQKLAALRDLSETMGKVLLIDSDILVRCDVGKYYDTDLGSAVFAGFRDYPIHKFAERPDDYVNFGFVLVDLVKLAEHDIGRLASLAQAERWAEQDVFNSNFDHLVFPDNVMCFADNNNPDISDNLNDSILKAGIVHYTGRGKGRNPQIMKDAYDLWRSYTPCFCRPRIYMSGPITDALGDGVIFADVVNKLNYVIPEADIDINCADFTGEILRTCGCRFRHVSGKESDNYWRSIDTPSYLSAGLRPGNHIIASMMMDVCAKGGFPVQWIKGMRLASCVLPSGYKTPEDYVLVPSIEPEKTISEDKRWNHWGELVRMLSEAGFKVYELNTWTEHPKTYSYSRGILYAKSLADTAKILRNARFTVTIENGLNHWACHNGGKTYCIFKSHANGKLVRADKNEIFYNTMVPVECYDNDSPEYVFSIIKKNEGI